MGSLSKSDAKKILMAAMTVNESGCDEMISVDFSRAYSGEMTCVVYVHDMQPINDGSKVFESFATYDIDITIVEIIQRILKYRKKGEKNDAV